jgi:phosphatidylinositol phospholipase C, gamma-1
MAFSRAMLTTGNSSCIISENEQIISMLERGTVVTKFYRRKSPEKKSLMLRRETLQLIWKNTNNPKPKEIEGYGTVRF